MGSYPISNIARTVEHQMADAGKKAEESFRLHEDAKQRVDLANLKSHDAYQAKVKTTDMLGRFNDLMVKARTEEQRKQDALYYARVHNYGMKTGPIEPIAIPPSNMPFAYGQPTPPASPVHYATGTVFQHNLSTPPASPQLQAVYSQVPQFADLSAANQVHVLAQQPGLSLSDQARLMEEHQLMQAYLAQQAQNSYMHTAVEQLNPVQAHSQVVTDGILPVSNPVIRFLNKRIELPSYKSFKEDHPKVRERIEALASELPTPIQITSKVPGQTHPWKKTRRLSRLQQINDYRAHLQKLISGSKVSLGDKNEVDRYRNELQTLTNNLRTMAADCNQRASGDEIKAKKDNRALGSYAAQLAQTAEELRGILTQHHDNMPTKKDQARRFTENLVSLDQALRNEFVNAYPEAISDNQRKQLRLKLQQSNKALQDHLSHELPVTTRQSTAGTTVAQETNYTVEVRTDLLGRIRDINSRELDALTEYEKPHLQLGDSLKVLGIGSVLSGAGYSLLKASPLKGLADPFAKLAFGGTLAGTLFSALPTKFTAPLIEGDVPKAFQQLMERSNVKRQAPRQSSSTSDHVKYFFQL